jgi:hypothetical protein
MPREAMPKPHHVSTVSARKQKFFALGIAVDIQHNIVRLGMFLLTDEKLKAPAKELAAREAALNPTR